MSGINAADIIIQLTADWQNATPVGTNYLFSDIDVTDGTSILGDDPNPLAGWRMNVQTVASPQQGFQLRLNLLNITQSASVSGSLSFTAMNVTPTPATQASDPFGTPLPSDYSFSGLGISTPGVLYLWPGGLQGFTPITTNGDWEWSVSLTIVSGGATKIFIGDPEMEVGDMP